MRRISRAWHTLMPALDIGQCLLVVSDANTLHRRTNKLFTNFPFDGGPTSVVRELISLCQRSNSPIDAVTRAFHLYVCNVPKNEQLLTYRMGWTAEPSEKVTEFLAISTELKRVSDAIDARLLELGPGEHAADESLERLRREYTETEQRYHGKLNKLRPLLKKWQPYGIFLKLAATQLGYMNKFKRTYLRLNSICMPLNLVAAPEICDSCPIVQPDNQAFIRSAQLYARLMPTIEQRIQASRQELARIDNQLNGLQTWARFVPEGQIDNPNIANPDQIMGHPSAFDKSILEDQTNQLVLNAARQAFKDAESHPDQAGEHLRKAITYWEDLANRGLRPVIYLHEGAITHYFGQAATCCHRIAQDATDIEIQATYYKKEAYFLSKLLEKNSNEWKSTRDDGIVFRSGTSSEQFPHPAQLFHWAAQAHIRAAQYCSMREAVHYFAKAAEFKAKAFCVEHGLDRGFNGI